MPGRPGVQDPSDLVQEHGTGAGVSRGKDDSKSDSKSGPEGPEGVLVSTLGTWVVDRGMEGKGVPRGEL